MPGVEEPAVQVEHRLVAREAVVADDHHDGVLTRGLHEPAEDLVEPDQQPPDLRSVEAQRRPVAKTSRDLKVNIENDRSVRREVEQLALLDRELGLHRGHVRQLILPPDPRSGMKPSPRSRSARPSGHA